MAVTCRSCSYFWTPDLIGLDSCSCLLCSLLIMYSPLYLFPSSDHYRVAFPPPSPSSFTSLSYFISLFQLSTGILILSRVIYRGPAGTSIWNLEALNHILCPVIENTHELTCPYDLSTWACNQRHFPSAVNGSQQSVCLRAYVKSRLEKSQGGGGMHDLVLRYSVWQLTPDMLPYIIYFIYLFRHVWRPW